MDSGVQKSSAQLVFSPILTVTQARTLLFFSHSRRITILVFCCLKRRRTSHQPVPRHSASLQPDCGDEQSGNIGPIRFKSQGESTFVDGTLPDGYSISPVDSGHGWRDLRGRWNWNREYPCNRRSREHEMTYPGVERSSKTRHFAAWLGFFLLCFDPDSHPLLLSGPSNISAFPTPAQI